MMESILQDIHICVFIEFQPAGVIFHWALFFKVPVQRDRCHFSRFRVSMIETIPSSINFGHPSNQTSMSASRTWSSVSTATQLGRSIKTGGSHSNLRNQRNAALKTPLQWMAKNHLGKAQSQMWGKKGRVDDSPFDFTEHHHFLSG